LAVSWRKYLVLNASQKYFSRLVLQSVEPVVDILFEAESSDREMDLERLYFEERQK